MSRLDYEDYVPRSTNRGRRGTPTPTLDGVSSRPTSAEVDAAIRRLPALPALLHELMRELRDADADINRLEQRISSDASLTTRVLKMANSPFYLRSGEVVDVRRAVMTLGFRTVANLVMAAGLRNTMSAAQKIPTYDTNGVFLFSLASGIACAKLPRRTPALRPVADEMFVAGLLHDVGRIAMSEFYPRLAAAIGSRRDVSLDPAFEHEHLGIDHQAVGRLVLERWGLPEELLGAITRHHDPVEAIADQPLVLAVAVVDAALELRGFARTGKITRWTGRVASLCRALGLEVTQLDAVLDEVQDEVSSLAGTFS